MCLSLVGRQPPGGSGGHSRPPCRKAAGWGLRRALLVHRLPVGQSKKISQKLTRKSPPNRSQDPSRGTQNRAKIAPETPPGTTWAPEEFPGASQGCPGASLGRPEGATGDSKGHPESSPDPPGDACGRPRRPFQGPAASKLCLGTGILRATRSGSASGRICDDFRSIFGCSHESFGTRCRNEFWMIFGLTAKSPTLMKHCP